MPYLPLPKDNQPRNFLNANRCKNTGLIFRKYLSVEDDGNSQDKFVKKDLQSIATHTLDNQYPSWLLRRQSALKNCCHFQAATQSRLLCGVGNSSITEVGLTFHPLYGFAIIPGGSLKGLVAHYFFENYHGKLENFTLMQSILFGHESGNSQEECQGGVIFYDAWPSPDIGKYLYLDVMTPHYSNYYSSEGNAPPSDTCEPTPIPFLSVKADKKFLFWYAPHFRLMREGNDQELFFPCKGEIQDFLTDVQSLAVKLQIICHPKEITRISRKTLDIAFLRTTLGNIVYKLIKISLTNWGIGAKSGSGYGYFKEFSQTTKI